MADRAELEQGVGALALALDSDLDCRAQPHCGIVEGQGGSRRARRAQVVVDRPLGPAERGGRAEVMREVREGAVQREPALSRASPTRRCSSARRNRESRS